MTTRARAGCAAALAGALLCVGCGGEPSPEADREVLRGPDVSRRAVTPARFVTDVTFVPFGTTGGGLHLRFRHVTSAESLERDYGAWRLEGDGWRAVLRVRDTLPVPRAAWRVLPADGLGVMVGPSGELESLVRRDSAGGTRLDLGETLAEWSSPTGQRERMHRARLASDGSAREGIAVVRKTAQGRDVPPPRGLYGFLLVTDSSGNALVIRRHGGTPAGREPPAVDSTAVGHALLEGETRTWPELRLARVGGPGRETPPSAGWSLEMPGAGIQGRLRPGSGMEVAARASSDGPGAGAASDGPAPDSAGGPADGGAGGTAGRDTVRLYSVTGTLRVLGRARPVRGLGVETGEP